LRNLREDDAGFCKPGFHKFEKACYSFETTKLDWGMAQKSCQSKGANLASIHSAAENMFIKGKLSIYMYSDDYSDD
jgi:hypothetical protein